MTNRIQHGSEKTRVRLGNGFEPLEARLVLTSLLSASELNEPWLIEADGSPGSSAQLGEISAQSIDQEQVRTGNTYRDAIKLGAARGTKKIHDYVGRGDRKDIYQIHAQYKSEIRIKLDNLSADAELRLLDGNRELINWSLRSGNSDEFIRTIVEKGKYFIRVDAFDGNNSTEYDLRVTAVDAREDTGGDSISTPTDLGVLDEENGISIAGWVGNGDRWDYYSFVAEQFLNIRAVLNRLTANANLYLYDVDHNLIDSSTNPGRHTDRIVRDISPGVYIFGVQTFSGNTSYQFTTSAEPKGGGADGRLADVPFFGTTGRDQDLNAMYAPEAWAEGITGDNIVVAVIDSGVDHTHRDLKGQMWENTGEIEGDGIDNDQNGFVDDVRGWDFNEDDNNPNDESGHGTHVAGIIASAKNKFGATGVAYNAQIMSIRVLDEDGDGDFGDLAKGIYYAVDNGADIINLSVGGEYNYSVRAAIAYANANGVFVSVASGNGGQDMPMYPARHSAGMTNTMSVGAHNRSDGHAWFSNYVGPSGAVQVDAPGVNVYSTLPNNRYGRYSGTSSAAPFVSGLAALVLSVNGQFSPNLVRHFIAEGAIREIAGSDSIGGIDAARTLYLARQYGGDPAGSDFGGTEGSSEPGSGGPSLFFIQQQSLTSGIRSALVQSSNKALESLAPLRTTFTNDTVAKEFQQPIFVEADLVTGQLASVETSVSTTSIELNHDDSQRNENQNEFHLVDQVLEHGLELLG